jgi:chorismate-pyruvate lyase
MIEPAPLAHEPSGARPLALLDLPTGHPQRQWEPFTRYLDRPIALTTALLQRWLGGRPVTETDLMVRHHGDRQYRVVSLVTPFDGEQVPLCHATAVVELRLLPGWVRDVLTRTDQSLARTLQCAGAVRDRTTATTLEPDPDAPGDAGLHTTGTFSLPAAGGRRAVAVVEEYFTGYVLELAAAAGPRHPAEPDAALVRLLHQRSVLAPDAAAPPRQSEQLVHLHRRSRGERPDAVENADRRGA